MGYELCHELIIMVVALGIEPRYLLCRSSVLPLNYATELVSSDGC